MPTPQSPGTLNFHHLELARLLSQIADHLRAGQLERALRVCPQVSKILDLLVDCPASRSACELAEAMCRIGWDLETAAGLGCGLVLEPEETCRGCGVLYLVEDTCLGCEPS